LQDTREEYQDVFAIYWPIAVGVFTVVLVLVVVALVRFRSRGADEFPRGRDASKVGEGLYALGVAAIAAALLYFTFETMGALEAREDRRADLRIAVTAAKWNWGFSYPRYGVAEQGTDRRPATLVVPADRLVRFEARSIDVQHAFWVPALRFKRDVFPRRTTTFTLTFRDVGFHREQGACAEFCGLRHTDMTFNVNVLEPAAFDRWARERREGPR
jgi:cytochrome c oxidase subunit 2